MAAPQVAGLPPFFTLDNGMIVRITAQSPTTGAVVSGVVVSNVSIAVDPTDTSSGTVPVSPVTGAYTTGSAV